MRSLFCFSLVTYSLLVKELIFNYIYTRFFDTSTICICSLLCLNTLGFLFVYELQDCLRTLIKNTTRLYRILQGQYLVSVVIALHDRAARFQTNRSPLAREIMNGAFVMMCPHIHVGDHEL